MKYLDSATEAANATSKVLFWRNATIGALIICTLAIGCFVLDQLL